MNERSDNEAIAISPNVTENIEYSNAVKTDVDERVVTSVDEHIVDVAKENVAPLVAAMPIAAGQIANPTISPTPIPQRDNTVDDKIVNVDATNVDAVNVNAERAMRQMSRRSFLWSALAVGATYGGVNWISTRRKVDGLPWPLRQSHELNAQISQELFSSTRLAPTFSRSQISADRVNGDIGLGEDFDAAAWQLKVSGLASGEELSLSLNEIKKLPRVEMTTELKCIEGWSTIVHWAGARFSDFAAKYPPLTQSGDAPNVKKNAGDLVEYVSLATPDGAYYVGMDMPSALHPQTLLCYEMNGKSLTPEHGAPLRLVTPVKYGIKHIKRIGTIAYSNRRPDDYWAEQGYDWFAGH